MVNSLMTTKQPKTTADQREGEATAHIQPGSEVQIFGELSGNLSGSHEGILLTFLPTSLPLKKRWRTNGLSADFLADYLATVLPENEELPGMIANRTEIQSAVSYIANELLENAMKFSTPESPYSINLQPRSNRLIFLVTNGITAAGVQRYQSFIQEAIASDPGEMLLRRLEQNGEDQNQQSSGLGLVTIMNDYLTKLGWRFEGSLENPEVTIVTTVVQLSI